MMRAVLVCVSILSPFTFHLSPLQAQDVQFQDIHYTVDENHLTAEVASNPKASGELLIPEKIDVGQNTYTVIAIGDKAFKGCKSLTTIVLPPSIERVYRSAFDGTGIMLKKENWVDGCLWIDSILIATDKNIKPRFVVPEGTRLIAAGAFQGNKTIQRVELPASVTRIDHETFRDCKNLQKVEWPDGLEEVGQEAFKDCIKLQTPDLSGMRVGKNAFKNCR